MLHINALFPDLVNGRSTPTQNYTHKQTQIKTYTHIHTRSVNKKNIKYILTTISDLATAEMTCSMQQRLR